jgi:hypothetical protein
MDGLMWAMVGAEATMVALITEDTADIPMEVEDILAVAGIPAAVEGSTVNWTAVLED